MTYTTTNPRLIGDAIVARLTADTAIEVGDGRKPADIDVDSDGLPVHPYCIVYQIPDGDSMGTLADPDGCAWVRFVVHVYGGTRQQAQWGQYEVRQALVGWRPAIIGCTCSRVELSQGAGIDRDDTLRPPLYWCDDEFRLFVSNDGD